MLHRELSGSEVNIGNNALLSDNMSQTTRFRFAIHIHIHSHHLQIRNLSVHSLLNMDFQSST